MAEIKALHGLKNIILFGFKGISMREHNSSIELEIEAVIRSIWFFLPINKKDWDFGVG